LQGVHPLLDLAILLLNVYFPFYFLQSARNFHYASIILYRHLAYYIIMGSTHGNGECRFSLKINPPQGYGLHPDTRKSITGKFGHIAIVFFRNKISGFPLIVFPNANSNNTSSTSGGI
jgi:hypothetical protein